MNTQITTLETLKAKKTELINGLRLDGRKNYDSTVKKIRDIEKQEHELKVVQKINKLNAEQARIREYAKQAYEAEDVTEDIITNSGAFHAVKIKKYPKLASIQYCNPRFEDGRITRLNINGYKFQLYVEKYTSGQPTEYTKPATFEEFLELNGVLVKDITAEDYMNSFNRLQELNEQLEKDLEKYSNETKKLGIYSLQVLGLAAQRNKNAYEYYMSV